MLITRTCPECLKPAEIEVDDSAYLRWKAGMKIQDAFPSLPAEKREMIMTGIHPACWEEIFQPS